METKNNTMPVPNMTPKLGGLGEAPDFAGRDGGFGSSGIDGGRFSFISGGACFSMHIVQPGTDFDEDERD